MTDLDTWSAVRGALRRLPSWDVPEPTYDEDLGQWTAVASDTRPALGRSRRSIEATGATAAEALWALVEALHAA
jgi:hypothetical protein